ncbi:EamA family transporter [Aliarcobacter trophiarum LMG 25534]|uniref:EamA family transporter n=1 Tax=Aliarcobacter trophiarum LMG 25534 TaxID=1032241 RepID=A0AAD0VM40_9BACT|nr:DMT family transporter [Aliarcobacter trophiarum]AXK48541.1 EamA/RhaT family transporter [Aliarcobacter trophiarum LMG 25534]RXI27631.1 EamA family transporter [Aliarcobacter trophiarum]RXJ89939.1 EamA family transporter [Aliarcobacter trophiarum LMG 25534]
MKFIHSNLKLFSLIFIVLVFFALNSVLTRMAIATENIDAFSFTFLRILAAMLMLFIIFFYKNKNLKIGLRTNYLGGLMFFSYAIFFTYSYLNMAAGIGTLILFAVVQLSMIIFALFLGEKLNFSKIVGIFIAFSGLFYLLYPKDDFTISYFHTFLMILSGISWAIYSFLGKKSKNALLNSTDSFFKAFIITFICAIFYLIFFPNSFKIDLYTTTLAIISGAITTAFGASLWYFIMGKIELITASIVQLLVPVIAIFLSVIFLNEALTFELISSTFIILFGIFIALYKKRKN